MPFVPVPKDLAKVKTKVAFNLTKRQIVCFGAGGLVGVCYLAGNSLALWKLLKVSVMEALFVEG